MLSPYMYMYVCIHMIYIFSTCTFVYVHVWSFYNPSSPLGVTSPSPTVSLPPLQLLADEIIAILMTTFSNKLSLVELTKQYNTCFRSDQPLVSKEQLLEAIKKLPNFKVHCRSAKVYWYTASYLCNICARICLTQLSF